MINFRLFVESEQERRQILMALIPLLRWPHEGTIYEIGPHIDKLMEGDDPLLGQALAAYLVRYGKYPPAAKEAARQHEWELVNQIFDASPYDSGNDDPMEPVLYASKQHLAGNTTEGVYRFDGKNWRIIKWRPDGRRLYERVIAWRNVPTEVMRLWICNAISGGSAQA